jgi:hypothetical protein
VNSNLVALSSIIGPKHRFAARQLVLLAKVLDFTDSTNRKVAGTLVKTLLLAEAPDCQQDAALDVNPEAFVGDGLSLGGDQGSILKLFKREFREYAESNQVNSRIHASQWKSFRETFCNIF